MELVISPRDRYRLRGQFIVLVRLFPYSVRGVRTMISVRLVLKRGPCIALNTKRRWNSFAQQAVAGNLFDRSRVLLFVLLDFLRGEMAASFAAFC